MKIALVSRCYSDYLDGFYRKRPKLSQSSSAVQVEALKRDRFGFIGGWDEALGSLGYEVFDIVRDVDCLQKAWALEQGLPRGLTVDAIALEQVRRVSPDIVWYDDFDASFLSALKRLDPRPRLFVGWVGSAVDHFSIEKDLDVVFSCAPETVDLLKKRGANAVHLHHSFDSRIHDLLDKREKTIPVSFVGQIRKAKGFHMEREEILLKVCHSSVGLNLYAKNVRHLTWTAIRRGTRKILRKMLDRSIGGVLDTVFSEGVHPDLRAIMRQSVFGLDMYQTVRDSHISLNIHADSSPLFASNMRLFEITGVGTCMVTDWRDNLTKLFEVDREVVAYKSADECAEKIKWLLEHPAELMSIASAGQQRTLRDHTSAQRACIIDEVIRSNLK